VEYTLNRFPDLHVAWRFVTFAGLNEIWPVPTIAAYRYIFARLKRGHGRDIGPDDKSLHNRAGLIVFAGRVNFVDNDDNGRAIDQ
jgi:hypothetical protein